MCFFRLKSRGTAAARKIIGLSSQIIFRLLKGNYFNQSLAKIARSVMAQTSRELVKLTEPMRGGYAAEKVADIVVGMLS